MKNLLPQSNYNQKKRTKFSDDGEFFLTNSGIVSISVK